MRSITLFVLLLTLYVTASAQSSFLDDSLHIVNQCQLILQNPSKADSIHKILLQKKAEYKSKKWEDVYYYNYSKVLFQTGNTEKAAEIAQDGLALYPNDSLAYKASKFHNILAAVFAFKNLYPEAIEEYTIAVKILESSNAPLKAALVKSNIGNLFFSLSDYQSAYDYCKEAMEVLKTHNDTVYLPGITAVVAVSAVRLDKLEEGTQLRKEGMMLSKKYNNPIGLIVSYLSEGEYQNHMGNFEASKRAYLTSLEYAEKYRQSHYIILDKIGLLIAENQLNNYQEALKYGQEAMVESHQLSNNNTRYAILKNISYAYSGLQEYQKAFNFLDSAHNLYISTASTENKAAVSKILIQYDSEKKERQLIERELKIASQKIKLNKRNNWIVTLIGAFILTLGLYWLYRRKKAQELLLFTKNAEKNVLIASIEGEEKERERLSNELHDGIASSLTAIRLKLEQDNSQIKDKSIISHLINLHEDTRRISHNLMPLSLHNISLENALKNYAEENSSVKTIITVIQLNKEELDIQPILKNSLYRICQELVQNVLKHAKSPNCILQINHSEKSINISVEDEGVGFDFKEKPHYQGLSSIKNRLKSMGGDLIIESKINEGSLIIVTLNK